MSTVHAIEEADGSYVGALRHRLGKVCVNHDAKVTNLFLSNNFPFPKVAKMGGLWTFFHFSAPKFVQFK
jgi:hypothetical protein